MKKLTLRLFSLISIVVACAPMHAQTANPSLTISGKELTLQMYTKCPQPRPSHEQLAQYLAQYDPSGDPRSNIYDETPWTKEEKKMARAGLVEDGFRYPNGQKSVITWMDFDGDGICDFTASAGIDSMRSTDRMFLFMGLPNGKFKLIDAYHEYMPDDILIVPYIPIHVSGEKLPVILQDGTLMQWQSKHKRLVSCAEFSNMAERRKRLGMKNEKPQTSVEVLCPHAQEISDWAQNQLPHKNRSSRAYIDQEK